MKNHLFILILFLCCSELRAQTQQHLNLDKNEVAIEGYDPVAYIQNAKAVEGSRLIFYVHNGAIYYFKTQKNLEKFKANPSRYLPAYGGWCAYAMGERGEKVKINPGTFKVINGKTYLFYNFLFNNTLDSWNKNEVILKMNADKNWDMLNNTKN